MRWHHLEEWENQKNWNPSVYILQEIQAHLQQDQILLLMEHLLVSKISLDRLPISRAYLVKKEKIQWTEKIQF